jgi:hypothetical protein
MALVFEHDLVHQFLEEMGEDFFEGRRELVAFGYGKLVDRN